uniref:Uncharacterized protein n=1 Tax=Arundo donax TaxID=35708 RepID=A0A0A9E1J8_ARUDO
MPCNGTVRVQGSTFVEMISKLLVARRILIKHTVYIWGRPPTKRMLILQYH